MYGYLNAGDRTLSVEAYHHGQFTAERSGVDGHDIARAVVRREDFLDLCLAIRALCAGLGCDGLILREIVRIGQDLFSGSYRYGILILNNDRIRDLIRKCQRKRNDQADAAEHDDGGCKFVLFAAAAASFLRFEIPYNLSCANSSR